MAQYLYPVLSDICKVCIPLQYSELFSNNVDVVEQSCEIMLSIVTSTSKLLRQYTTVRLVVGRMVLPSGEH